MDEEFIRKVVKCKMDLAGKAVEHMPSKARTELRELGTVILGSLNECVKEMKSEPPEKEKPREKLNSVPIE